ncbi:MAG: nitroreductase [Bacteroidales bacterium]|nr:nitroreductase [Bacteroidales bacterium]
MDILQAMEQRHSVRAYTDRSIEKEKTDILFKEIESINAQSGLSLQLILDDKDAFNSMMAHYGKFVNVTNYIAVVGKKSEDFDTKAGYYGEKLVLLAQTLGLNTCWVALTYNKKKNKIHLNDGQRLACVIALGYGQTQGVQHKIKTYEQVVKNPSPSDAQWFKQGVHAALLAPTAMNQQKFKFELDGNKVKLRKGWGFYTKLDLGIVKYHFEAAAGTDNFTWQ